MDAAKREAEWRKIGEHKHKEAELEDQKEQHARDKSQLLVQKMMKYPLDCSLKLIKKPMRLELRFEKSFTLAVKENKQDILELFPRRSVKPAYVSMHALKDYKAFKLSKHQTTINDVFTTPLHIAAECSNIEAVRTLI